MTVETLAPILLLVGAGVGCIELVLATFWVRAYWSGPAFSSRIVTREVLSPSAIKSLVDRPSSEAVFIGLEFRELPPGLLAFRERLWERHPRFGYYGVVRGALRPVGPSVDLLLFPNWSAVILVAGVVAGLVSGGWLRF